MPKPLLPEFVPPMMEESTKAPFDSPDWIFEIKLDGYRAITVFDAVGKPHLWSRNGLALEAKFPAVATAVSKLKLRSTILDGEVVAVAPNEPPATSLSGCAGTRFSKRLFLWGLFSGWSTPVAWF
jgi:ATP-dependent DNA ligase